MIKVPGDRLWNECERKKTYKSERAACRGARKISIKNHKPPMRAYKCTMCWYWHLTSQK